jgi:hypothetical protein
VLPIVEWREVGARSPKASCSLNLGLLLAGEVKALLVG